MVNFVAERRQDWAELTRREDLPRLGDVLEPRAFFVPPPTELMQPSQLAEIEVHPGLRSLFPGSVGTTTAGRVGLCRARATSLSRSPASSTNSETGDQAGFRRSFHRPTVKRVVTAALWHREYLHRYRQAELSHHGKRGAHWAELSTGPREAGAHWAELSHHQRKRELTGQSYPTTPREAGAHWAG